MNQKIDCGDLVMIYKHPPVYNNNEFGIVTKTNVDYSGLARASQKYEIILTNGDVVDRMSYQFELISKPDVENNKI
jgi:hypothetical protein